MSAPLWYLLVIVGGALFGYGTGWIFDWNERRKWRRDFQLSPEELEAIKKQVRGGA